MYNYSNFPIRKTTFYRNMAIGISICTVGDATY